MLRPFILSVFLLVRALGAPPPGQCVASLPLGSFEITVRPEGSAEPKPLRAVNLIDRGHVLAYRPLDVPAEMHKNGRIALILVPADRSAKLTVFEPHAASVPAQWTAPYRVSAVGLVAGPQGLDQDRVSSMLNKDRELISQLAAYAEQTAQVENLIDTLAAAERAPSANLEAAISGFAERYGSNAPKLDRKAPTDEQAQVLLRALVPALSAYDPLGARPATRMQQSAGLAASVASLFFGSNVGLAAGGAAMAQNLKTLMFPSTDFRSALASPATQNGFTLCAARQQQKSRTRIAYLWAHKVPDAAAPKVALASPLDTIPGTKISLALQGDWRRLERANGWTLVHASDRVPIAAATTPQGLHLDFASVPPGTYQLAARWDWEEFTIPGQIRVHARPDLSKAALAAPVIQGTGNARVVLTGADFRFVREVRMGESVLAFQTGAFSLDTSSIHAGDYKLIFTQADESRTEVTIRILPPNPVLKNLPLRVNLGEPEQRIALRGTGLERIEKVAAAGATLELGHAKNRGTERELKVVLAGAKQGEHLSLALHIDGLQDPVEVPSALEILGPRPRIAQASASLPDDLGIELREGELPAGSYASFSVRLEHAGPRPVLSLECDDAQSRVPLRPGEKRGGAKLESAGSDLLFLSVDAAAIGRPGCTLAATVEAETGTSDATPLGRLVRLPRIESFVMTAEKAGDSAYFGTLVGQDLELIEKTGWDSESGLAVQSLPRPLAGGGQKQTLRISMPWPSPSPQSALHVWLRGEDRGRTTQAKY